MIDPRLNRFYFTLKLFLNEKLEGIIQTTKM